MKEEKVASAFIVHGYYMEIKYMQGSLLHEVLGEEDVGKVVQTVVHAVFK